MRPSAPGACEGYGDDAPPPRWGHRNGVIEATPCEPLVGGKQRHQRGRDQAEKGHGRLTTRSVRTSTEMNDWFAEEWTGMAQTFQVIRTVKRKRRKVIEQAKAGEQTPASEPEQPSQQQTQTTLPSKAKSSKKGKRAKQVTFVEETSQQVVYGFSNLTPTEAHPQAIATFLRNHWAIENRLHWRRDVTLREDHSQMRSTGKPQALAALNNIVLSLMDWLGVPNLPDQMRTFAAFPRLALDLLLGPLTFD